MTTVNNYMKKLKLSKILQSRIRKYITYIWDKGQSINFDVMTEALNFELKYEFTT